MRGIMTERHVTMIRRLLSVLISVILTAGFVSRCAAETEKTVMTVLRVSEIPAREWQKTAVFPDWKGYPDNTLAMVDASRDLVIVYLTNKINSPVTDGSNPNKFDGNAYTASSLGFVPQILSIGLDEQADISAQLMDLLADMAAESLKLIPEDAGSDHPSVKNARSKIAVLKAWAEETGKKEYALFAEELTNRLAK